MTHPDDWREEEAREQERQERAAVRKVERAATKFAQSVFEAQVESVVWRFGDGAGGWVYQVIGDALSNVGLDGEPRDPGGPRVYRVARRDGWRCHYCARPLGWGHESVSRPEVEHLLPRVRGGSDRLSNVVLACGDCNRAKGSKTPVEWLGVECCEAHREVEA